MTYMDNHIDYVTSQVLAWLGDHRDYVKSKLDYMTQQNADAGNDPNDTRDEDIEYLAGELEDFTVRTLVDPLSGIVRNFVRDCVSEVDWTELAMDYLEER